jgi:hypothetical protein
MDSVIGRPADPGPRGLAPVLVLACLALLAVGCGNGPATITPGPESSQLTASSPTAGTPTAAPIPTAEPPSAAPATEAPTPAPPSAGPTTPAGSPAATPKPEVSSLKAPRTPSCTSDNGTGTVGYIRISWTSVGTTGVRLSIDPPSPGDAYDYGYADYPAAGSADVPFSCDPPNHDANGDYHLYVVTTLHTGGYYAYRYAKVYQAE